MLRVPSRLHFIAALSQQPFIRLLLAIWAATGIWDLALSEWIPEEYAKRLPRVYQVIAMTTGFLSWQVWIVVGAVILAMACLEYEFRRHYAKLITAIHNDAGQLDTVTSIARYKVTIPWYILMLFGLLIVILSGKIIYDDRHTANHYPAITYLPENDVITRHVTTPIAIPGPKLVSTAFHEVYKCQYHWPVSATPKERARAIAKIEAASKTMENVFGVSVRILKTNDSVGMELTPLDPSNIRVFGGIVKKLTEEIRYLNDDYVIVTITYDAEGLLGQLLGLMPPPDLPGARDQQRKLAASMLQIDDSKCELL